MSSLLGYAWVTPFGDDMGVAWERVHSGVIAPAQKLTEPAASRVHWKIGVPDSVCAAWFRNPRLRRSSAISLYAVQAGMKALESAGLSVGEASSRRLAVIFAVSSGGVVYTRRFYQQIVEQGANNASPLLFPETVYNAPASHMAHLLGVTGSSYTLVGDSTVGLQALYLAETLLDAGEIDLALVIGAEELDWVLCEAYSTWGLLNTSPEITPFAKPPQGTVMAEGAAAVLLGREKTVSQLAMHPGISFLRQKEAAKSVGRVVRDLCESTKPAAVVSSANGTFIDHAENSAIESLKIPVSTPKQALGEAPGAGALQQVVYAAELQRREALDSILVLSTGWNQQASGVMLKRMGL